MKLGTGRGVIARSPLYGHPRASWQALGAAWSSCHLQGCSIWRARIINILCLPGLQNPHAVREEEEGEEPLPLPLRAWGALLRR